MTRRLGALFALLATLAALVAAAPPAAAAAAEVEAITTTTPAMNPGQTAWVSVIWKADKNITSFRVTAAPPAGVTVSYPSDRAYTSLYGSSSLAKNTQDFTAIKVSVPYSASGSVTLPLTVTWKNGSSNRTATTNLTIPLVAYAGPDLSLVTTSLRVPQATPTWVQVRFRGAAPSLNDFRVTATAPEGIAIVYPGDGTSSGLNGASTLQGGTEDYTSFRVDATGVPPGTYTLQLTETFNRPNAATSTGTVDLVVQ